MGQYPTVYVRAGEPEELIRLLRYSGVNVRITVDWPDEPRAILVQGPGRSERWFDGIDPSLAVITIGGIPTAEPSNVVARLTPQFNHEEFMAALQRADDWRMAGDVLSTSNKLIDPVPLDDMRDLVLRMNANARTDSRVRESMTDGAGDQVSIRRSLVLPEDGVDLKRFLATVERDLIEEALAEANDVVARAAARLHIGRTTLVEKMRKYGIERRR